MRPAAIKTGCGVASQKIYWQVTGPLRTSPSRSLHGRFRKRKKKSRFHHARVASPDAGERGFVREHAGGKSLPRRKILCEMGLVSSRDQQKKCCCAPLQMKAADDDIKSSRPREAAEERGQSSRTSQWHALGDVGAHVESL